MDGDFGKLNLIAPAADGDLPNPPIPEPALDESSRIATEDNPFDSIAIPTASRVKQIWAIGGGKGGVGKSLVAASLAISLSRNGQSVVAIDLDLGAANLHTTLGVMPPKQTLSDFFLKKVDSLEACRSRTEIAHLDLISGAQDTVNVTHVVTQHKPRLMQQLRELDADYVIIDLGAGTQVNTLDFFIYADIGIITILPEPTSIENAYRFIKSIYFRRLKVSPKLKDVQHIIDAAITGTGSPEIKTPTDLFHEIQKHNAEAGIHFKAEVERFKPKLLLNQIRTQTDIEIGFSVKSVVKKYFGIDMDYVGYLDYDSAVWQAIRRKRPLMVEFPNSKLVSSVDRIANYLLKRHGTHKSSIL